jgi:hypothetical protein
VKRISHLDNGDVSWLLDLFIGGPGDLKNRFKPYHMKGLQETQQQLIAEVPGDERETSRQIIRTRVHTYEQSIAFDAFQPSAATDAVRFPVYRLCHNRWFKIADRRCWKPIDYGRIQKRKGIEEWPDFGSMFSPP